MSNGSTTVTQNCQVIKQNIHSEGVPEEICKKNRMRLHELSRLLERDNQSVFSTNRKKAKKENKVCLHLKRYSPPTQKNAEIYA